MRRWMVAALALLLATGPTWAEDEAGLRQRVYDLLIDRQAKAKITEASGTGASYIGRSDPYGQMGSGRMMAACVDWSGGSVERLRIAGFATVYGSQAPRQSDVRRLAMDTCAKWEPKGCACQIVDEDGRNRLTLPASFTQRALATPRTPALVAQIAYDRVMALKAKIALSPPAEGGTATTRDYWSRKSGKVLAACIGWTGDTLQDMKIGGSGHRYAKGPAATQAERDGALRVCRKVEKPFCQCQIVDEDEKNVLQVPPDFTARVLAKGGG